jgi:hypothetical protein
VNFVNPGGVSPGGFLNQRQIAVESLTIASPDGG